jgi:predicted acylesterase/phospholipase RssA
MKALAISGGSTKIAFLAGAAVELHKNNDYKILTGISAGSIICLLLAINELEILKDAIFSTNSEDFFRFVPVTDNDKVKIRSVIRVLMGKESLAEYRLKDLLKDYYKPEHHEKMQNCGKIVKIGATNLNLKQIEYCDITKVDYETALDWVVASSSIPLTTQLVKIGQYYYTDGGVKEHVGGIEALNSGATELDVLFSRSEINELTEDDIAWKPKNIVDVLFRVLNTMSRDISDEDEKVIYKECRITSTPLRMWFAPFTLTRSLYKMDPDLSKSWFSLGSDTIEENPEGN